jgi:hypothetical protein
MTINIDNVSSTKNLESRSIWDTPINFTATADDEYPYDECTETDTTAEPFVPLSNSTSTIIAILLENSERSVWEEARTEWRVTGIFQIKGYDKVAFCKCGQRIKECCYVQNSLNGTELILGNCCVKAIRDDISKVFQAIRDRRINAALIAFAVQLGYIDDWEKSFLEDVWRMRWMSPKQSAKFQEIKNKIYDHIENTQAETIAPGDDDGRDN